MDGEGGEGAETGEGGEGAESGAGNGAGGQAGSAGGGAEGGDSGASAAGAGASGGEGGALPTCTPGTASGTRITFQSPTATFSQTSVYNFSVTQLIDGIVNDERGWAVSETNGAVNAQTAALETASNTPSYSGGTRLTFIFVQNYSLTGDHALGHFRLAVTTADRAQFADGIDGTTAAGDVGSGDSWTVLAPLSVCGLSDVAMTVQNDGSVLVAENDVVPMVYTVIAETSLTGITGVRLEALKDPSLPHEGPGLQTLNGNFVLSEFEAYYEAR
jgi:hypothetical protein